MSVGFVIGTEIYSIVNHRLRKRSKYEQQLLPNKNNHINFS